MSEMLPPLVIATRGSALALAQANTIRAQCRAALPGTDPEIKIIKTTGDKLQTASLASLELPKGLFTKELEMALLVLHWRFAQRGRRFAWGAIGSFAFVMLTFWGIYMLSGIHNPTIVPNQ